MSLDAISLYRRALRLVKTLEGQKRRRLCAFRTKQMLLAAGKNHKTNKDMQDALLDVDIYLDQMQEQATHLHNLSHNPEGLIVPLELYKPADSSKPLLDALPGRKKALVGSNGSAASQDLFSGRLFQGPEPSWLRAKSDTDNRITMRVRKRAMASAQSGHNEGAKKV